jgi:hypothetical protein
MLLLRRWVAAAMYLAGSTCQPRVRNRLAAQHPKGAHLDRPTQELAARPMLLQASCSVSALPKLEWVTEMLAVHPKREPALRSARPMVLQASRSVAVRPRVTEIPAALPTQELAARPTRELLAALPMVLQASCSVSALPKLEWVT